MERKVAIFAAIFLLMALSNGVVPALDTFAADPAIQGLIFSAYFFGAMLIVLPAGIASERYGPTTLMRLGIAGSVLAGVAMVAAPVPWVVVASRLIEGVATGLFVSAGLAFVNSGEDHERSSGLFMASLNGGLLAGLVLSGVVVQALDFGTAGVAVFTVLTLAVLPFVLSISEEHVAPLSPPLSRLLPVLSRYRWLYYATVVIFGAGGAVTGLYPEFSTADPGLLGFEIALQNLATIVALLAASRLSTDPIRTIRVSSFGMAVAVAVSFITPFGFALIGASAGVVQIAQLAYLARTGEPQGVVVGVFTTGSYAGMTVLPVLAALVAESFGYAAAFGLIVLFSLSVGVTIERCRSCSLPVTGASIAP